MHLKINIVQNFKTDYKNLVPSATLTYMLKPGQTFRTSYNTRIQRPGICYLNPYQNTSDTMYISSGNPNLDAVKYHSMNLNYSFFNPKINLHSDMSYNFTNNGIEEITRLENSVSDTNYENIARSRSLRFSGYANWVSIAQTVAHNIPALENNIHLQTPEITLQGKA